METNEQFDPIQNNEGLGNVSDNPLVPATLEDNIEGKECNSSGPTKDECSNEVEIPMATEVQDNIRSEGNSSSGPDINAEPQGVTNLFGNDPTQDNESLENVSDNPLVPVTLEDNIECKENNSSGPTTKDESQDECSNEVQIPMATEVQDNIRREGNSSSGPDFNAELQDVANVFGNEDEMSMENGTQGNISGENNTGPTIKAEPQETDVVSNEVEMPLANALQENTNMANYLPRDFEAPMKTNEPINGENAPIYRDVPIAKDSNYLNDIQFAVPVSTDDFLGGITTATPPARPMRIRVKSEFFLREDLSTKENSLEMDANYLDAKDQLNDIEEIPPPPSPPSLSSKSISEIMADGIATPRISLLALNRLKVKTEFPQPDSEESSVIPPEFFSDLLKVRSPKEAGEVSSSDSETDSDSIPPNFFDDLLDVGNIEQADIESEAKYSDRLKEKEKDKSSPQKKQKKSKKKSRKRSKSGSPVKDDNCEQNKRSRLLSNSPDIPLSKDYYQNELETNDSLWALNPSIHVKQEPKNSEENEETTTVDNVEEINENLTPDEKRERALKRATVLLNHLSNSSSSANFITSTFDFVSTVCKLPTSHSYVQERRLENRSPLHSINNVSYNFESDFDTPMNMEEWGLAALTPHAAEMAKLIGCDAEFIYEKLKTIGIPLILEEKKQENIEQDNKDGEDLVKGSSSLFFNVMTQTDDDIEGNTLHKGKCYDIGVQVEPSVYSIGSQTLETQSPTKNINKYDESPIMNIIRDLNENQLVAIHSFAELIKEPAPNVNAMDMYQLQRKISEIYKISQIPSAFDNTLNTHVINNYTTTYMSPPSRKRKFTQSKPIIQSVESADSTQFSINDPRANSAVYAGRIINSDDDASFYRNSIPSINESRHYASKHSVHSSSIYRQPPTTSTTRKGYGRGSSRR